MRGSGRGGEGPPGGWGAARVGEAAVGELVKLATSNQIVSGRNVVVEPSYPFAWLATRQLVTASDPQRAVGRAEQDVLEEHESQVLGHGIIEEL